MAGHHMDSLNGNFFFFIAIWMQLPFMWSYLGEYALLLLRTPTSAHKVMTFLTPE